MRRSPVVAMITPLPADPTGDPPSGVATYSAKLLDALPADLRVIAFAQRRPKPDMIGNHDVQPVWTGSWVLPFEVRRALKRSRVDVVHLQHEVRLYGSIVGGLLLAAYFCLTRLRGLRVVTTIHGVVDPGEIDADWAQRHGSHVPTWLVRHALQAQYVLLHWASDRIIVHHDHFAALLSGAYAVPASKITTVPIGMDESSVTIDDRPPAASDPATSPSILLLGFLTGYKDPTPVLEALERDLIPGAELVVCMGPNPRHRDALYQRRYAEFKERVERLASRAQWRGYVAEDALPVVLKSADVLVLPYIECISASAVATLAVEHGLAVCYSRPLERLFGTTPWAFDLDADDCARAVRWAIATGPDKSFAPFVSWDTAAAATARLWAFPDP